MANYWQSKMDELEEEKKKKKTSSSANTSSDYWQNRLTELEKEKENKEDIAPVKTRQEKQTESRAKSRETSKYLSGNSDSDYGMSYAPGKTVLEQAMAHHAKNDDVPVLDLDVAPVKDESKRDATFLDATWNSAKRGYYNSLLGEEAFAKMSGQKNDVAVYKKILQGDEYQFQPDNWFEEAVSGAFELVGQQFRQTTHPRTLAIAGSAAGAAAIAGQAGPQVLAPEEAISVPAAFFAGLAAGNAGTALEIEAGHAYLEMTDAGISHELASKIALGVGVVNAGIEALQVDELIDAYKVVKGSGATKTFTKKIIDELLDRGIDVAKETAQEVVQEGVTITGAQIASKAEKGEWEYSAEEVGDRLLDTAKSSALSFGMMNVPATGKNITSIATEQYQENKLSNDEKVVVDKATEALVAEREKKYGRELTSKEKTEAQKEIRENLEHGGLDVESIAEILGGESYETFKAEKDSFFGSDAYKAYEQAQDDERRLPELQKRYDELRTKMPEKKTGAEQNEEATLLDRINAIKNAPKSEELKAKLDPVAEKRMMEAYRKMHQDVFARVKGSRLAESYAEQARSQEKLDIDVNKYTDENARKTVQAIIDSGLGDNSNAFKHFVDFMAKIAADKKDIGFDLTNNLRLRGTDHSRDGLTTNGYKLTDENGTTIVINKDAANPLRVVVGHEFAHVLEKSGFYDAMADSVLKFAEIKEGKANLDARMQEATRIYKDDKNTTPEKEVVADLIGEYVFTDYKFISNLASTNPKGFMKLFAEVKYLARIATAGSKEARELAKVKNNFERAYREFNVADSEADGGVQHSIVRTKDMSWSEQINGALYDGKNIRRSDTLIAGQSNDTAVTGDIDNKPLAIPQSVLTKASSGKDISHSIKRGKLAKLDEGIKKAPITILNPDRNAVVYVTDIKQGGLPLVAAFDLNAEFDGDKVHKATSIHLQVDTMSMLKNLPETATVYIRKNELDPVGATNNLRGLAAKIKFIDGTVSQKSNDVNTQHSFSKDSDGNQLSDGQKEFFKDSKVRDLNGNLKPMYHGTQKGGFYVFDPDYSDDDTSLFFTDRNDVAMSYSGTSETYAPKAFNTADELNSFFAEIGKTDYEVVGKDGRYTLYDDGDEVATSESLVEIFEEFKDWEGVGYGDVNYKVYLNLKNPLVVDADGRDWNALLAVNGDSAQYEYIKVVEVGDVGEVTIEYAMVGESVPVTETVDLYKRFDDGLADTLSNLAPGESVEGVYANPSTTRDYAKYAKEHGYDGVIFENIYDIGGYGNNGASEATVAIAFDSNQVKSTANKNPTADPDIRYSLSKDSQGRDVSKELQNLLQFSNVRDENGHLIPMYHGTPNGSIAQFKAGTYFTDNKEYADRYQNPGASSISTGKTVADPKTFEVYLDIRKPFDLNDPEARRIYIEEYIKGGNAIGINPYLSDAEYAKIKSIDWTEGEDLRDFLIDNDYDYDGLVLDEGADGGYGEEVKYRGKSYVIFRPDQAIVPAQHSLATASNEQSAESKFLKYTRGGVRRDTFADKLADLAPVRQDVAQEAAPVAQAETPEEMFPDAPLDAELDSLIQRKEALEEQMLEMSRTENFDSFKEVSAEWEAVNKRIEALEKEANEADADRMDSLVESEAPPEMVTEQDGQADVIPLTKKTLTDVARDVRNRLMLSNKDMYDVHKIIEDYSQSEFPSREQLFEELKEKFGTYTESQTDDTIKEAKSFIRKYRLNVADSVKKEIPDYVDTMRKNRGRILFANDGMDVNSFYVDELTPRWPHLFPESIDVQTDQFNRIVEVANMDATSETEYHLDDETIWDVADSIIQGISDYKLAQKEKASNKYARESFNSLMRDADEYVPPLEDDIAPVVAPVDEIAPTAEGVTTTENVPTGEAQKPVNETLAAKIAGIQTELDNNRRLRDESNASFDQEIARLQAEYDAKKNKNTLGANDLLRRIERMKRLKQTVDADFGKRIGDLESRIEKMSTPEYQTAEQRRTKMQEHTSFWENLLGDTSTWKDMALGLSYKTQTLRRILRKVVRDANGNPDIGKADMIYDALETKYDHNEALLKRESQKLKEVFQNLKLNRYEDTYAHMAGEFRHNPETTITVEQLQEYYNKHKNKIDVNKVNTAIKEARKTFDDLIVRVNEVLKAQGMKEIPYRKGYFPHFQNPKQNWFQKLINWKPVDNEIPTSIAGLTEMFEPQRSWQGFNKQRKGDTTDYSLYQGLDTYIHGALDWIYHIDDLQSRRALENHIRYTHSEEGVKAKIEEIKANESYDADEAQAMIDAVLEEAKNPLNGLVQELMRRTNTLANKKASGDRKMESDFNRKVYSTMTNLNNRVNANMVVGSFSSALTNFIPMVQSWVQVNPWYTLRGLGDYVRSAVKDDGMIQKSDYLTNRLMEEENLYQTGWDKVADKAAFMMNVIDNITSQTVWRSKYLQNLKEGMSESQAIKDADQFAKNLMAGRSRGNAPTIFDEKNPVTKIFTAFQLEVANQYGYMFDDAVKDSKSPQRLIAGYATAFLGSYLYNALYSSLVGRDAAFDPMGIIEELLRDLGVGDDDDEEEEDVGEALLGLGENILQQVPYVGGLLGGGRIPISSALPYNGDFKTMITDAVDGEFQVKELLKPLYYLALPVGGGQIKKTVEGFGMFSDEHPVSGSYTASGKLRYPVEKTAGNVVQAAMFGQYANENARYYFDNDIAPLGEKQIQEYKDLDLPIRDYWDYREGLKGKDTLGEKLAYIDSLDLPIRKQNILANNLTDRKEPIDMADWDKYDGLEEYNYAKKYPEKHKFLESIGISYDEYESFDDDTKEAYSWAYQNPEKYTVSKAVTGDLVEYKKFTSDLSDIKADKDKYGDTISGSAKEKKIEYINNLNLDYGQKIILYRSLYNSQDDRDAYNADIVEYLNSRNDLAYDEIVTILRELDFTVLDDGTVLWD